MRIQEYISFRYKGEEATGQQQYETVHAREHYDGNPEALALELWKYYYVGAFGEERPSRKYLFLDYHYHAYAEEKIDFVNFVKKSPSRIPDEVLDIYIRMYLEGEFNEVVNGWLESLDKAGQNQSLGGTTGRGRIKLKRMSLEEAEAYFMGEFTATSYYTGEKIMTEDQVKHFLHANIEGFNPAKEVEKVKTKGDFKDIIDIIYRFYQRENSRNAPTAAYCQMALDNFYDLDRYTQLSSLQSNFSKYTE